MPMYYPDLKSVKKCAEIMSRNTPGKEYKGIIPSKEEEVPEARKQLGKYFREVWKDEIQALEVEEAVSEDNYDKKISDAIMTQFLSNPLD